MEESLLYDAWEILPVNLSFALQLDQRQILHIKFSYMDCTDFIRLLNLE